MYRTAIIQGEQCEDVRGKLIFFNEFDMKDVKRFYVVEHSDTSIVRAWQGHKIEQKWFYVIEGSFKVVIVKPEEWQTEANDSAPQEFILKSQNNQLLHIPGGFANGFKALQMKSKLIVFSDFEFIEAGTDDYRFDKRLWYQWK